MSVFEPEVPTALLHKYCPPFSNNSPPGPVPAILEEWSFGPEGGPAAAQVLFGDVNPGGKLPITFPRSVGQLPTFYNHKPSRNRTYIFSSREPLFPFGFGLSYTSFRFENPRVEPDVIAPGQSATVRVEVTNTGNREGDEVPQLYIDRKSVV